MDIQQDITSKTEYIEQTLSKLQGPNLKQQQTFPEIQQYEPRTDIQITQENPYIQLEQREQHSMDLELQQGDRQVQDNVFFKDSDFYFQDLNEFQLKEVQYCVEQQYTTGQLDLNQAQISGKDDSQEYPYQQLGNDENNDSLNYNTIGHEFNIGDEDQIIFIAGNGQKTQIQPQQSQEQPQQKSQKVKINSDIHDQNDLIQAQSSINWKQFWESLCENSHQIQAKQSFLSMKANQMIRWILGQSIVISLLWTILFKNMFNGLYINYFGHTKDTTVNNQEKVSGHNLQQYHQKETTNNLKFDVQSFLFKLYEFCLIRTIISNSNQLTQSISHPNSFHSQQKIPHDKNISNYETNLLLHRLIIPQLRKLAFIGISLMVILIFRQNFTIQNISEPSSSYEQLESIQFYQGFNYFTIWLLRFLILILSFLLLSKSIISVFSLTILFILKSQQLNINTSQKHGNKIKQLSKSHDTNVSILLITNLIKQLFRWALSNTSSQTSAKQKFNSHQATKQSFLKINPVTTHINELLQKIADQLHKSKPGHKILSMPSSHKSQQSETKNRDFNINRTAQIVQMVKQSYRQFYDQLSSLMGPIKHESHISNNLTSSLNDTNNLNESNSIPLFLQSNLHPLIFLKKLTKHHYQLQKYFCTHLSLKIQNAMRTNSHRSSNSNIDQFKLQLFYLYYFTINLINSFSQIRALLNSYFKISSQLLNTLLIIYYCNRQNTSSSQYIDLTHAQKQQSLLLINSREIGKISQLNQNLAKVINHEQLIDLNQACEFYLAFLPLSRLKLMSLSTKQNNFTNKENAIEGQMMRQDSEKPELTIHCGQNDQNTLSTLNTTQNVNTNAHNAELANSMKQIHSFTQYLEQCISSRLFNLRSKLHSLEARQFTTFKQKPEPLNYHPTFLQSDSCSFSQIYHQDPSQYLKLNLTQKEEIVYEQFCKTTQSMQRLNSIIEKLIKKQENTQNQNQHTDSPLKQELNEKNEFSSSDSYEQDSFFAYRPFNPFAPQQAGQPNNIFSKAPLRLDFNVKNEIAQLFNKKSTSLQTYE